MSLTPVCRDSGGKVADVFKHKIGFSALFSSDASLVRTPTVTGNRRQWGFRCIYQPNAETSNAPLMYVRNGAGNTGYVYVLTDGRLSIANYIGQSCTNNGSRMGNPGLLTDPTRKYDICVSVDSSEAIEADRMKAWIDGVPVNWSGTFYNTMALNKETWMNLAGADHAVGLDQGSPIMRDSIEDYYFIDGPGIDPNQFGEWSDLVTGLWIPKAYDGAALTGNSYHPDFEDQADMGRDTSELGNHYTTTGTITQTVNTRTNKFAILNPLIPSEGAPTYAPPNLTNGNVTAQSAQNHQESRLSTFSVSGGKYYAEFNEDANFGSGGHWAGVSDTKGGRSESGGYGGSSGSANGATFRLKTTGNIDVTYNDALHADVDTGYGAPGASRVWQIAIDGTTREVWFGIDNVWINGGDPANGTNPVATVVGTSLLHFATSVYYLADQNTFNFGATGFTHTPPEGFVALCAENLPEPTIRTSSTVAEVVLRVGSQDTTPVSGLAFPPDLVNMKGRDVGSGWGLFDIWRGPTYGLFTHTTDGSTQVTSALTAFNPDGYVPGAQTAWNELNKNFVDLCLKFGVEHGCQAIEYEGNGVAGRPIAHNLGKAPTFMLVKRLDVANDWAVYHVALGADSFLRLNATDIAIAADAVWNQQEPTSTEMIVGTSSRTNASGGSYIAYLFTDSDIFKAFSFICNAQDNGPFANLGGKALSVPFLKNADIVSDWYNFNTAVCPFNPINKELSPNTSGMEDNYAFWRVTSGGLKTTYSGANVNGSGNLMVGLAIIEQNEKYT